VKSKFAFLIALAFILAACAPAASGAATGTQNQPALITGSFEYTNDFVTEVYYVEHAVALLDLTGFVKRDKEWELPVEGQVLGYMKLDAENNRAEYRLALPLIPEAQFNDVDNNGKKDQGVQIFTIAYSPNLTGDVFSAGDDRSLGWPAYLASIKTDTENQDEITGGKLVVWAADASQSFPSGFGADGLLFTADDPLTSLPAGYSVVDLDAKPFKLVRTPKVEGVALFEPTDVAVKDFTALSYSAAFTKLLDTARKEYAFNGIAGKAPDYDAIAAQLTARVQQAEKDKDSYAYYLALRDFALAFNDGHVGISGGANQQRYNAENILGGYGFAVRELDDKSVVVVYVLPGGPADQAGMQVGDEIITYAGLPVSDAISRVVPFSPQSTEFGKRYEQTTFLTRGSPSSSVNVVFRSASGAQKSVSLAAMQEFDSLFAVYMGGELDETALPAEYRILPQGVGYLKINSNYDDLNLLVRIVGRAFSIFDSNGLPGVIIDLRLNFGGANMGLAGFLTDQEIPLGQLEYYSEKTGKFEPEGPRGKVLPNVDQYRFGKIVLLVDQFCYSACELEAYGFSQVPEVTVMGQFPTAGVEAETARGEFEMPGGITFSFPTGRFTNPDGSIFLEGVGVQPDVRLPVTRANVLSETDAVLQAAVDFITTR